MNEADLRSLTADEARRRLEEIWSGLETEIRSGECPFRRQPFV
jgi:hypothetical protein